MSIYAKTGTELSTCYDVSGVSLDNAYDVDGENIFTKSAPSPDRYSIWNVESYFRERMLAVCQEINALSSDWQSFIHITDTHGNANKQHSQAIGMYVLDNTPASFLVLGGDYIANFGLSTNQAEYRKYASPFLNSGLMNSIYAVMGNHEYHPTLANDSYDDVVSILYNDFFKDKSNLSGNLENCYCYFDDSTNKIRYILLNTSDHVTIGISNDQLAWLAQSVILPDSSWSLWVIGHTRASNMGGVFPNYDAHASIVEHMKNCNGSVVGYLCGHEHCDYLYHNGYFEEITMQGDLFSNRDDCPGISITDRVAGTISEQAVSVISFNTKTKQVVIRRIGAGRNQTMSYAY